MITGLVIGVALHTLQIVVFALYIVGVNLAPASRQSYWQFTILYLPFLMGFTQLLYMIPAMLIFRPKQPTISIGIAIVTVVGVVFQEWRSGETGTAAEDRPDPRGDRADDRDVAGNCDPLVCRPEETANCSVQRLDADHPQQGGLAPVDGFFVREVQPPTPPVTAEDNSHRKSLCEGSLMTVTAITVLLRGKA